jgi:hypothetical protein
LISCPEPDFEKEAGEGGFGVSAEKNPDKSPVYQGRN